MDREELSKLSKEEQLDVLWGIVAALTQKNAELETRVKELESRLNMNSKNSSKPPSSDGFKKQKSQRKPSGKAPGGQSGHDGSGLKLPHDPDEYVTYDPVECADCPSASECSKLQKVSETRYEIDIKAITTVTAHQTMRVWCPWSKVVVKGRFPSHINSTM